MKGGKAHALIYAGVLGIASSVIMTGVGRFTAPFKDANAKADRIRNILSVLDIQVQRQATATQLLEIFDKNVRLEGAGDTLRYVYAPADAGGTIKAVALPFEGAGVWGPIKEFLALEPDLRTIKGLSLYQQEETPGLGGEIGAQWFLAQFRGKSIRDRTGADGIRIKKKGTATAINEVDGITGATGTCNKLTDILNAAIRKLSEEPQ